MMRSTDYLSFGIGLAAVLCTFSCTKENLGETVSGENTDGMVTISLTTDIRRTKTTLDQSEPRLHWSDGDSFDLFSNGGDGKSTPVYNSVDTEISAEVNEAATEIYAVYPANPVSTAKRVVVEVPEMQSQTAGGVLNGANVPMYAKGGIGADGKAALSFSPFAGLIALNIYSTEETIAKVTKVQVNPLDADGNFVVGGFCGKAKTSAAEFSYLPLGESNGIVLTLGTPCEVASAKPANEEATKNFDGQLYVAMARAEYAGIQFIVTTDDGKMYVAASSKPLNLTADTGHDILYFNLNLAGKSEISDDFYGQYNAGLDITICGNVINRRTYPKAQVKTIPNEMTWDFLASPFDDETNGGILFIDNDSSADSYKATASTKEIGKDRIIIGRYRNANQPVLRINKAGAYRWMLDGKVMMKNITLSSFNTSMPLFTGKDGAAHGVSEFFFEDCTLTNTNTIYGIFTETSASYAVPKSMRFDNCILRANASFFSCSKRTTVAEKTDAEGDALFTSVQNLKSLIFNECVFAPATLATGKTDVFGASVTRLAKKGAIVALYYPNYTFDDLDISLIRCSSYDLGPESSTQGIIDVTTIHSVKVANCMFWHSATIKNMYLTNVLKNCTGGVSYNVSATYSNKVGDYLMSFGPKSKFIANGGSCVATVTQQDDLFGACEPAKHYFPKSPTFTMVAGADYGKKYWIVPSSQQQ